MMDSLWMLKIVSLFLRSVALLISSIITSFFSLSFSTRRTLYFSFTASISLSFWTIISLYLSVSLMYVLKASSKMLKLPSQGREQIGERRVLIEDYLYFSIQMRIASVSFQSQMIRADFQWSCCWISSIIYWGSLIYLVYASLSQYYLSLPLSSRSYWSLISTVAYFSCRLFISCFWVSSRVFSSQFSANASFSDLSNSSFSLATSIFYLFSIPNQRVFWAINSDISFLFETIFFSNSATFCYFWFSYKASFFTKLVLFTNQTSTQALFSGRSLFKVVSGFQDDLVGVTVSSQCPLVAVLLGVLGSSKERSGFSLTIGPVLALLSLCVGLERQIFLITFSLLDYWGWLKYLGDWVKFNVLLFGTVFPYLFEEEQQIPSFIFYFLSLISLNWIPMGH